MRWHPVGVMENFLLRMGPSRITAIWELDGTCDLDIITAQIRQMIVSGSLLNKRLFRMGFWHFWESADLLEENHIQIIEDDSLKGSKGLYRLMSILRRLSIREDGPRWRAFVVNPARSDGPRDPNIMSALVLHFDHAIADGIRITRFVSSIARKNKLEKLTIREAGTKKFFVLKPKELQMQMDRQIADVPLAGFSVPMAKLRGLRDNKNVSVTERILTAGSRVIGDPDCFAHKKALTGNSVVTRFTRLNNDSETLGNHLQAVEYVSNRRSPKDRKSGLLGATKEGKTSDMRIYLTILLPTFVLRPVVRSWYAARNQLLTLTPAGPSKISLGGRQVKAIYGLPPILAEPPLTVSAVSYDQVIHFALVAGEGHLGNITEITERYKKLLLDG